MTLTRFAGVTFDGLTGNFYREYDPYQDEYWQHPIGARLTTKKGDYVEVVGHCDIRGRKAYRGFSLENGETYELYPWNFE